MTAPPKPPKGGRWLRTRLNARAGQYTAQVGPTKQVARAVKLSDRRIRQIRDGSCPGVPQKILDWIDALADDPRTNPYPVAVMILDRIHERIAMAGTVRPWEELTEAETRAQGAVDLLQIRAERDRSPAVLEALIDAAGKEAALLLEIMGCARAELARGGAR
jgi:hypothetical protein